MEPTFIVVNRDGFYFFRYDEFDDAVWTYSALKLREDMTTTFIGKVKGIWVEMNPTVLYG